jgi:hypothetical protein
LLLLGGRGKQAWAWEIKKSSSTAFGGRIEAEDWCARVEPLP